jgi:glycosyltransferase involved in cell wall biosynthesis
VESSAVKDPPNGDPATVSNILSILLAVCGGFWLLQLLILIPFLLRLRHEPDRSNSGDSWPKFFISMPLRGADDNLEIALRALLDQDYPNFEVRIVIDHETDHAWEVVRNVAADRGGSRLCVETLQTRHDNCSLVCSSVVQLMEDLEEQDGLLAFCAGDMHPPPNWLREMATLLADPVTGTTLGNRWFVPPQGQWGSLVQYLWNAGAVVPMWILEIPWAGAAALRLADVRSSGLVEEWRRAMVEDAPIKKAVRDLGLRCRFSPQLLVVDRGEVSLPRAFQFIFRQLFWTRLYHPNWTGVVLNALLTTSILVAPWFASVLFLGAGNVADAIGSTILGLAYILGSAGLVAILERGVRQILRARGERVPKRGVVWWLRTVVAIPIAQLVYASAMVLTLFARRISWRGIDYVVDGPWDVHRLGYRPFNPGAATDPFEVRRAG